MITPMIGSVEDLVNETKKELSEKSSKKLELDLKTAESVWKEHKKTLESPSSKNILDNVKIKIIGDSIKIIVPNSVSKEEISQESGLYKKIREKFNNNDLIINIDVDRSVFPELQEKQGKKIYTMKEKYDHLVEKNPDLDYLINKLKLKIDHE